MSYCKFSCKFSSEISLLPLQLFSNFGSWSLNFFVKKYYCHCNYFHNFPCCVENIFLSLRWLSKSRGRVFCLEKRWDKHFEWEEKKGKGSIQCTKLFKSALAYVKLANTNPPPLMVPLLWLFLIFTNGQSLTTYQNKITIITTCPRLTNVSNANKVETIELCTPCCLCGRMGTNPSISPKNIGWWQGWRRGIWPSIPSLFVSFHSSLPHVMGNEIQMRRWEKKNERLEKGWRKRSWWKNSGDKKMISRYPHITSSSLFSSSFILDDSAYHNVNCVK